MAAHSADTLDPPQGPGHLHVTSDEEDEGDVCRICRCSGSSDNALFHPCKCSGSIKYVHQDCLTHWLQHSGNTHCEVCKHKFVFTPVYAKDAPVTLPWHELAVGLVSRAARAIKVAHRVWVVSCVWLIVVPWITCLAWRISFLRSFNEVPRLLRERCHVLAVATDCIQGSLLSIGIVFLNIAFTGLKDQVKAAVTSLEHQLMRDTGPAAAAAAPAAVAEVAAAPAAGQAAAAAAGGGPLAPGVAAAEQGAAAAAGEAAAGAGAAHGGSAAGSSSAAAAAAGGGSAGAASSSSSADSATSTQLPPSSGAPGAINEATAVQHQQQHQQHNAPELLQDQQQQQMPAVAGPGGAPADLAPAGAAGNDIDDVLAVVDADAGADPARDDADAWGDVPFEELLGLQGPWVNFFETIVLVMIGNACFMAGVVYVPLNIGRLLLMLLRRACAMMPLEQQLSLRQALSQPSQSALADEFANFMLVALANAPAAAAEEGAAAAVAGAAEGVAGVGAVAVAGAVEAAASAVNATAAAVAANVTAVAAAVATNASAAVAAAAANVTAIAAAAVGAVGPAAMAGSMANNTTTLVLDAVGAASSTAGDGDAAAAALLYPAAVLDSEPLPLVPLRFDQVFKELQAQLELPASADFMALTLGHMLLVGLLILVLWLYVSVRLWTAARRRVQRSGQPLIQVVKSICRWVLSAVSMVGKGAKLMLLLCLELGAFPLAAGLWLDICALPLTSTSLGQRGELLAKTPLIAGFMHWVLGVGFLLGFTFLVCVVREVLRPGALPFLKDPTNPERNPVQEMLDEPLLRHLARVAVTWVAYAGLCVVTVHLPALLAQALVPSLYPLRVALFDPLTQIPADMLLLHIFIPFTVEHVRVKGAVKAAVTWWLTWVGRLLGWSEYLLPAAPPAEAPQPAAAAAVAVAVLAPAAAEAGTEEQVEVPSTGSDEPAAVAAAPEPGPSSTAAAAAATAGMPAASLASGDSTRKNSHPPSPLAAFDLQLGLLQGGNAAAPGPSQSAQQQQQQQQQEQQEQQQHGTGLDHLHQPLLTAPAPPADHNQQQQQQQRQQQQRPVQYFEQQPCYTRKLLGLGLSWLVSVVLLNCLLLTVPIGLGRALFHALRLPFKNDLFTGAIGLLAMWGSYSLAAGVATSANVRNVKAVLLAAGRWLLLAGQCAVLLVLWLGVVATMLGMLCELVLLPLRLPPNQTALIYLYQDWTMGVLALKLWHLLVMVTPRRDGRLPPDPDSWQAHFDALQAGGLRNLDFHRALTKIVLPVLLNLATSLALPYVVTRGLLPLLGLPAIALQYANLYGHQVYHGVYLAWLGSKKLHQVAVRLHDTIRDDRYLVGRELRNFELQQQQEQEAERLRQQQLQQQQQEEPAVAASEAADEGGATAGSSADAQAVVHDDGASAAVMGLSAGGEISVAL